MNDNDVDWAAEGYRVGAVLAVKAIRNAATDPDPDVNAIFRQRLMGEYREFQKLAGVGGATALDLIAFRGAAEAEVDRRGRIFMEAITI